MVGPAFSIGRSVILTKMDLCNSFSYRIPEASGGFVNVNLICCNARETVDIDNKIDIDIDICFTSQRA